VTEKIHSIRVLTAGDWATYRDIRSCALRTSPGFFVVDAAEHLQRPETAWQNEFSDPRLTVIAAFHAERPVGMTTLVTAKSDASGHTVISTGSYVEPDFRRSGLFGELAWFAIDLCRDRGFKTLLASHKDGNVAVQTMIQNMGFVLTDRKLAHWADGSVADEVRYSLNLGAQV
jgi:GNAT superfamily N-acetyltransferase